MQCSTSRTNSDTSSCTTITAPHDDAWLRRRQTLSRQHPSMPYADVAANAPTLPEFRAACCTAKKRWKVSVAALNFRLHKLEIASRTLFIARSAWRSAALVETSSPNRCHTSSRRCSARCSLQCETTESAAPDIAAALHVYESDLDWIVAGLVVTALDGGGQTTDLPAPDAAANYFSHRAEAAFRAISERWSAVSFSARAGPPFRPPPRPISRRPPHPSRHPDRARAPR